MPIGLAALLLAMKAIEAAKAKMSQREAEWKQTTTSPEFPQGMPNPMDMYSGGGMAGWIHPMDQRALRGVMEAKQILPMRIYDYLATHPEEVRVFGKGNEALEKVYSGLNSPNVGGYYVSKHPLINPYIENTRSIYIRPDNEFYKKSLDSTTAHELAHAATDLKYGTPNKSFPGLSLNHEIYKKYLDAGSSPAGEELPYMFNSRSNVNIDDPSAFMKALEAFHPGKQ